MRKISKEQKRFKIGACFGAFISILLIIFSIFFSHNFVAKNFSPDGILQQPTIFYIVCIRLGFCILGAIGILICVLYIIKPSIFIKLNSNLDQIWKLWKPRLKYMLFLFPIVFVVCTVLVEIFYPFWYKVLMQREDSIIEWLTFIFFFIASIVSFSISITYYKRNQPLFCWMYMVLALGLFIIAGEEISWGQRIFNFSTPVYWEKYNYQNETNIHNIRGGPCTIGILYVIVGFYGAFARFIIPKKVKNEYGSVVNLFVPDYYLFFYFFVICFLCFYFYYLSSIAANLFGDSFGIPYVSEMGDSQEPSEFLLSCGFLLFVIINKYRQVSNKNFVPVVTKMKHLKNRRFGSV